MSPGAGRSRGRKKPGSKRSRSKRSAPAQRPDPSDGDDTEVRYIQPYQATKPYVCPGCNRDIPPGQGHMVAVPAGAPDLRRHWHRGCWVNRHDRR